MGKAVSQRNLQGTDAPWLGCFNLEALHPQHPARSAWPAASPSRELHSGKDAQPSCAPKTKPTRGCMLSSLGMESGALDRTVFRSQLRASKTK